MHNTTMEKVEWCNALGIGAWSILTEFQVREAARIQLLKQHPDRNGCRGIDPIHILHARKGLLRYISTVSEACPMDADC